MVAAEVQNQQRLVMSFMNHMAVQRQCRNFMEDTHVVGITNYLDIGMQVAKCPNFVRSNCSVLLFAKLSCTLLLQRL